MTGLRSDSEVELRTMPNQGVWRSVQFCLIALAIGVVISALAMLAVNLPLYLALFYLAMLTVLAGGGSGLVHLTLRFVLWADGCMPWNYARFLDHCCDRALLQKVGGGYIFIHRLLLEHFVQDSVEGK